jgi:hypothetical protein
LYSLGTIYDRELKLRYNALSVFSFTADRYQDGVENDYYDKWNKEKTLSFFSLTSKKMTGQVKIII